MLPVHAVRSLLLLLLLDFFVLNARPLLPCKHYSFFNQVLCFFNSNFFFFENKKIESISLILFFQSHIHIFKVCLMPWACEGSLCSMSRVWSWRSFATFEDMVQGPVDLSLRMWTYVWFQHLWHFTLITLYNNLGFYCWRDTRARGPWVVMYQLPCVFIFDVYLEN